MLNKVMLIGRPGAEPELRYTRNGAPMASFSLATSERWHSSPGDDVPF